MIPRSLPPVHSPIPPAAVRRAWSGLLAGQATALNRVRSLLVRQYHPREVLLTDSGTTALALALRLAAAARPDRPCVALPAWACYDLATAADTAELGVVLYDVDPATLGPDWDSLDRALAAGVAAVVVVHAYGLPVNLLEVASRAARSGTLVIEDAAQAIGAALGDLPAGACGALGVLSFGRGKGWTGGGGGALLLNPSAPAELTLPPQEALAARGGGFATAARLTAQYLLARPGMYSIPSAMPFLQLGQTVYRAPSPTGGMSRVEAAVLLQTAPAQSREADHRRANAGRLWTAASRAGAGSVPAGWEGGRPGWLRLPLLPTEPVLRRAGGEAARRLGIMPGYPMPLSRLPGFGARIRGGDAAHPGAEQLATRLHTLPTHGLLKEPDLVGLEDWLRVG